MKNSKSIVYGLGFALALCVTAAAKPAQNWASWVENYYVNPDAAHVVPAVYGLSRSGYFEQAGQPATAIGFLAAVFAQNPDKVEGWMHDFRSLPAEHQRLVAAALWYSGLPGGADRVRALAHASNPGVQAAVDSLVAWEQPALKDTPVLSQSSLDLQWGAFLGSGDAKHVTNVLAALGSPEASFSAKARLALAEKALAHPRVYEICRAEIARQPAGVREELSTALLGRSH